MNAREQPKYPHREPGPRTDTPSDSTSPWVVFWSALLVGLPLALCCYLLLRFF